MELRFNKWGNSLGVRFPKVLTEMLGVAEGSSVDAQIIDGKLVISPAPLDRLKALKGKYTLTELMAQVPEDYDPAADEEARDWRNAPAVGKEIIEDDWS